MLNDSLIFLARYILWALNSSHMYNIFDIILDYKKLDIITENIKFDSQMRLMRELISVHAVLDYCDGKANPVHEPGKGKGCGN